MPRTAAWLGMLTSLATLSCTTTVYPGLANAPALGTNPSAEASVHDAVANGREACGRGLGPGPLRSQVPACPGVEQSRGDSTTANRPPDASGIVMPWVEHYYSRVPCSAPESEAHRLTLARTASLYALSERGSSGMTCGWPL